MLRLLRRLVRGCGHGGLLTPVAALAPGVDIWRCESCGREIVLTDG